MEKIEELKTTLEGLKEASMFHKAAIAETALALAVEYMESLETRIANLESKGA